MVSVINFPVFILVPTVIAVCVWFLLWRKLWNKPDGDLPLRDYALGYGGFVVLNVGVFITTIVVPIAFIIVYIIIFIPFMLYSFRLNRKLIKDTGFGNKLFNFIYKLTITIFIWFMAFFPFSWFGAIFIMDIPAQNARRQEVAQFREDILNSEIYADLTRFGLGIYKLKNEGDRLLWDITQPGHGLTSHLGLDGTPGRTPNVFRTHENRRADRTWNDINRGKDIVYNVYLYEGTYIIMLPADSNLIYLTKDISENVDIFRVFVGDPEVMENLRGLPGKEIPRREMVERLGKDELEDVPRAQ